MHRPKKYIFLWLAEIGFDLFQELLSFMIPRTVRSEFGQRLKLGQRYSLVGVDEGGRVKESVLVEGGEDGLICSGGSAYRAGYLRMGLKSTLTGG